MDPRRRRWARIGIGAAVVVAVVAVLFLGGGGDDAPREVATSTSIDLRDTDLTVPAPDSFFVFDGQSNSVAPDFEHAYPTVVIREGYPGMQAALPAIGGTSYPTRTASAPERVDVHAQRSDNAVLFTEGGQADLLEDATADEIFFERIKEYVDGRRAAGFDVVISMTVPPSTFFSEEQEEERLALNELLLTRHDDVGIDAVADVAALDSLQDPADTDYFYDGVHFTTAAAFLVGQEVIRTLEG
jgi:hypothetical protein